MRYRWPLSVLLVTLLYSFALGSDASAAGDLNGEMIAKIKVGSTTRAQVKELLGAPSRMNNYGDCNPVDYQETWEYLGHDANGAFKISIEFDEAGIARIVAKTPAKGPVVVLAAAPRPNANHQH
jgi:outer membrane protein assembly factor BamE (lipoprotein component of BamABCDE complex)